MIQIILTSEQQAILAQAQEPIELVDIRGRVLGRVLEMVTVDEMDEALRLAAEFDDLTSIEHGLSTEDLKRIAKCSSDFRPAAANSTELMNRLRSQTALPS